MICEYLHKLEVEVIYTEVFRYFLCLFIQNIAIIDFIIDCVGGDSSMVGMD